MKRIVQFVSKEFLFNGHLQSLSAVSIAFLTTKFILKYPIDFYLLITVYLFFELIHIYDRYKDLDKDKLTNTIRVSHISSYAKSVNWLLIYAVVLIFILIFTKSNLFTMFLTAMIIVLGVFYPLYFKRLTVKIPLFKNFYVASVYSLLVFYTTSFITGKFIFSPEYLVFAYFILYEIVANQAMSDFKDIKGDMKENLLTLPVMLGKAKARDYIRIFYIVNAFIFILLVSYYNLHSVFAFLGIVGLIMNFVSMELAKTGRVAGYFMNVGKFLLMLLFVLMTGFIWFN